MYTTIQDKKDFIERLKPFMDKINFDKYNFVYEHYFNKKTKNTIAAENGISRFKVRNRINREIEEIEAIIYDLRLEMDMFIELTINSPIEHLGLSVRAQNVLNNYKIYKIRDLKKYSLEDIIRFRDMGETSLRNIIDNMKEKGLDPRKIFKPSPEDTIGYFLYKKATLSELLGE